MAIASTLEELRTFLSSKLAQESVRYWGDVDTGWNAYAENYHGGWDASEHLFRCDDLKRYGFLPNKARVLDLAAGSGQFLQHGSAAGYEVWGVEPEEWKRQFISAKLELTGAAAELKPRLVAGIGEALPFLDSTFDCVTTYQTLEHVQNPELVLHEMVRVTKAGGGIYIRCPDYRSTFEGHYRLPWLPLFPRPLARAYLRAMKRPLAGLDSIQYVTKPRIKNSLARIERSSNTRLLVIDDSRVRFENELRRRGIPLVSGGYEIWQLIQWMRCLFRNEVNVNLFVRVLAK